LFHRAPHHSLPAAPFARTLLLLLLLTPPPQPCQHPVDQDTP
jgi:hypothetical protein